MDGAFFKKIITAKLWLVAPVLACLTATAQEAPAPSPFKIDPNNPLVELLPVPPLIGVQPPVLIEDDRSMVPEVMIEAPLSRKLSKHETHDRIAHSIAKINNL